MKKTMFALLSAVVCAAAAYAVDFSVKPDREMPIYKAGETATVTISATENGAPLNAGTITYTVTNDGVAKLDSGTIDLSQTNPATIKVSMKEPGFARVTLNVGKLKVTNVVKNAPSPTSCGIAFSPEKIVYAGSLPQDFGKFWMDGRKAIAKNPVELTPMATSSKIYKLYKVKVESLNGPVYGFLTVPTAPGKHPAAITVPGAGPGLSGPDTTYALKNYITLTMNVHEYETPTNPKESRAVYSEQGKRFYYPTKNMDNRDQYFFRRVILGVDRAINHVAKMPEYNGREMIMYGSSQGGAMTLILTGLNKNITACAANVPAMCDHAGIPGVRPDGWPHTTTKATPEQAAEVTRNMMYFDAVNFARFIKVPTLVSCGLIDATCPCSGIFAAYNLLGTKTKKMYFMPGLGHVQTPDYVKVRDAWLKSHSR